MEVIITSGAEQPAFNRGEDQPCRGLWFGREAEPQRASGPYTEALPLAGIGGPLFQPQQPAAGSSVLQLATLNSAGVEHEPGVVFQW